MATIFPSGLRVLGGPFDFQWGDVRTSGPNSPSVYITAGKANYAGLLGGEVVRMSRGSTLQFSANMTVSAPGGGPGTKTRAELITDINNVFGIAGGAPTNFAWPFLDGIRLADSTVGPNTGYAGVDDYTAVGEAAKNALFQMMGFPANTNRDQTTGAISPRFLELAFSNDDSSQLSSNVFVFPGLCKALLVEAQAGTSDGLFGPRAPGAAFALAFSNGTAAYDPGLALSSEYMRGLSAENPVPLFGTLVQMGRSPIYNAPVGDSPIVFQTSGFPSPVPLVYQKTSFVVEIPTMNAVQVRCLALGSPDIFGTGARNPARLAVRVWGLG